MPPAQLQEYHITALFGVLLFYGSIHLFQICFMATCVQFEELQYDKEFIEHQCSIAYIEI